MEKAASITVEIDETVLRELQKRTTHTGQALSALLQELTQEALRMRHYPGIVFTEGPAGRRATLLEPGLKKGKGDRLLFLGFFGVLQKVVLEKVACPLLSPLDIRTAGLLYISTVYLELIQVLESLYTAIALFVCRVILISSELISRRADAFRNSTVTGSPSSP